MKIFHSILVAFVAFAFVGCSQKEQLPATKNVPAFSSAKVNEFVKTYATAANDYVTAVKAKDTQKIVPLATTISEVSKKTVSMITELKGDEIKKFQDWMNSMSQQLNAAIDAAGKQ